MRPYSARHLIVLLLLALMVSLTTLNASTAVTRGLAATEPHATPLGSNAPLANRILAPGVDQVVGSQALFTGLMLPADADVIYGDQAPAAAQFPARTLQPLALSGHIAFESNRSGDFGLYARDADGSRPTVTLLDTTANEVTPRWSPDGSELLFASDRDGDYEIFRRLSNGSEIQLTFNTVNDIHPSWSPDGSEVIFASDREGPNFSIYSMTAAGGNVRQLAAVAGQNLAAPNYAPNGQRITYMQASVLAPVCQWNWDVWLMNADGGNRRRITSHLAADLYPRWTPDGQQIIYAACANFLDSDLYTINPDSGARTQLVSWFLSNEWGGVYSPDSTHVAFDSDSEGGVEIFIAPLAGGAAFNFTQHPAQDLAASWPARPAPATYSVAGRVTSAAGAGVSGVTISAGAAGSATTDSNGAYTLSGLAAGAYTLTPSKGGYTFSPSSRTVTVPPSATVQDFVGAPPPKLKLLYVPLRWQGSQDSFDAEARTQSDFFIDDVPLKDCQDQVVVETLDVGTQNFSDFTCSENNCGVGSVRTFVKDQLQINPADYDVIVGLGETSPCAPIAGCSNQTDTIWVTAQYDIVTAHELGHIYGLADQYCSNQAGSTDSRCNDGDSQGDGADTGDVNWLDASLPCDCPSDGSNDSTGSACCNFEGRSCATKNYGVCCQGNKNADGGRSTMSYANASEPRGFDIHDKAHLDSVSKLNCGPTSNATRFTQVWQLEDVSQTILDVNLRIHSDDSVDEESITLTKGRRTPDAVLENITGNYSLELTNASGQRLWTQNFALHFDYNGPVVLDTDYSDISYDEEAVEFRIPYQCGMRALNLYHSGRLVFSKQLKPGCLIYLPIGLRDS